MNERLIRLSEKRYAVQVIFHMVTERTLFMSVPNRSELYGKNLKFAAETSKTAGNMRLDNPIFEKVFPDEMKVFKNKGLKAKDFVLVQVID